MLNDCCTGSWSESIQMDRRRCRGPVKPVLKRWQFDLPQALELANSNQDKFPRELGEVFTASARYEDKSGQAGDSHMTSRYCIQGICLPP